MQITAYIVYAMTNTDSFICVWRFHLCAHISPIQNLCIKINASAWGMRNINAIL